MLPKSTKILKKVLTLLPEYANIADVGINRCTLEGGDDVESVPMMSRPEKIDVVSMFKNLPETVKKAFVAGVAYGQIQPQTNDEASEAGK